MNGRSRTGRRVARGAGLVALVAVVITGAATASASASASPAPATRATDVVMGSSHGTANSLDWAGYAVTGTTVTSVSGSWIQPSATCPANKPNQSAFWVGLDGYAPTDPTVQQIGTDADCVKGTKKVAGGPTYYAWYELYPSAIVVIDGPSHPLSPGDAMTASVVGSGNSYTLTITDAGRWTFSTVQTASVTPLDSSAEWIAEAPTACKATCKAVKLADFGSVTFTGATANGQAVNAPGYTDNVITMTKNAKGTKVKASTSPLIGGSSFSVTWVQN